MDNGRIQKKENKIDDYTLGPIPERWWRHIMPQEKKKKRLANIEDDVKTSLQETL